MTSVPFMALTVAHCGQNWGFWMLLTEIPAYLNGILGMNMAEVGLSSAESIINCQLFLIFFFFLI